MQLKIKPWGNSAGIPLSKPLLQQLETDIGDSVNAEIRNGSLVITPVNKPPTLKSLLAGSPRDKLVQTEEDWGWIQDGPAGKELL